MSDPRIFLTRDPAAFVIEPIEPAVCAVHRRYPQPEIRGSCLVVPFEDLERDPRGVMGERRELYLVGLSRTITPSNRTHEVWEILFNNTPTWRKISIDTTLFVGEPWRAWFHWGFVGARYREYTYSYLAESHWQAHREGLREDDPFALEVLVEHGRGVVQSDHRSFFDAIDVQVVPVATEARARYDAEKASAFEEEHTEAGIIRRLAKIAREACTRRSIPTSTTLFGKRVHRIVRTDLPVDVYVTQELLARAALADGIAEAFHVG